MAEQPHGLKAETGTVELHHEPAAFGVITAPMFVAIAMLVVLGIVLWKRVPAMIGKMLDAKIDSIRRKLDEASALRAEAEAELAKAKARNAASEADAAAIVAHAEAEAKALLKKFGSFAEVVHAPVARLREVDGVKDASINQLKLLAAAASRIAKGEIKRSVALSSWNDVIGYCRSSMAFADKEQFRILFLDKKNQLIADEVQGHGTVDHTPVYVREVVKRALELSATAIILVHNHPSGDPTPSRADIDMTKQIIEASRPLGVTVHDHVIVGRNGHASLKALRLI